MKRQDWSDWSHIEVPADATPLLPRLRDKRHGLVTIYNDGGPSISVHRTVFEKRAPASIPTVQALIAPAHLGQGNTVRVVSDDLLAALTDAYREAVKPSGREAARPDIMAGRSEDGANVD